MVDANARLSSGAVGTQQVQSGVSAVVSVEARLDALNLGGTAVQLDKARTALSDYLEWRGPTPKARYREQLSATIRNLGTIACEEERKFMGDGTPGTLKEIGDRFNDLGTAFGKVSEGLYSVRESAMAEAIGEMSIAFRKLYHVAYNAAEGVADPVVLRIMKEGRTEPEARAIIERGLSEAKSGFEKAARIVASEGGRASQASRE